MIGELLAQSWAVPPSSFLKPHPLPADSLDPLSYYRGCFLERSSITESEGWTWKVPDWRRIPGGKRPRFARVPMFCANRPGSQFKLSFTGTAIGTYIVGGPDAGFIDVVIDRGAPRRVRLAGAHSHDLNDPWTRIFSGTLKDGEHVLEVSFPDIPKNLGKVARLMYFVAN